MVVGRRSGRRCRIVACNRRLPRLFFTVTPTYHARRTQHFWLCKEFLPGMIARNSGHIVTIASAAGMMGVSHMVDYCGTRSKGGWGAGVCDEQKTKPEGGSALFSHFPLHPTVQPQNLPPLVSTKHFDRS